MKIYDSVIPKKQSFPPKNTVDKLEDEIAYCEKLVTIIQNDEVISHYPKVKPHPFLDIKRI